MADDARKVILARRARFVAAAMVGIAASGCGKSNVTPPDASVTTADAGKASPKPRACLVTAPDLGDAGVNLCDPLDKGCQPFGGTPGL